jgi:hypothetical protein
MPYESGETPKVRDRVIHKTGRMGMVTDVQLEQGHLKGEDQISVKWDDGGVGVGMALAREFALMRLGTPG